MQAELVEGGLGKDIDTGGGFLDTYVFKMLKESRAGERARRDEGLSRPARTSST